MGICGRWTHKPTGKSYNVLIKGMEPPIMGDIDAVNGDPMKGMLLKDSKQRKPQHLMEDGTCEDLVHRSDDNPEALKKRLVDFYALTMPIVKHYTKLHKIVKGGAE